MAKDIVNGTVFLKLPNGTIFRDINLQTDKPESPKMIKSGLVKDCCDKDVIGYYFKYAEDGEYYEIGEECSARRNCPSACKFLIV